MKKIITIAIVALLAGFLLIQLVPFGRQHTNPPIVQELNWSNPEARQIAQRACYDCHSNETVWPWYSSVAPVSWLVARHVQEGRQVLNFSDWAGSIRKGEAWEEIPEVLEENEMPPAYYDMIHPAARLTPQEKQILIDGLQ